MAHVDAQTVDNAFPELLGTMPEHYVYGWGIEFLPSPRPDVEAWVRQLRHTETTFDEQRCIIVYRRGKEIAFIRLHAQESALTRDIPDDLYKIGPDYLELVKPWSITNQRLWTTQIGAARWVWRYDATGRVTSEEIYRSAGGGQWTLIERRPSDVTR